MIQNNITFNNVNADTIYKRNGKYTHGDNANGDAFDPEIPGDELTKSFNAVEIDWNGATTDMGGQTKVINTTGELISYLATAYTNAVNAS